MSAASTDVATASTLGGHERAKYIDHTLLGRGVTRERVVFLCGEAIDHGFANVCVEPAFVETAVLALGNWDSTIPVCTVIAFPSGEGTPTHKADEAAVARAMGAREIDMVIDYKRVLATGDFAHVRIEVEAVVRAVRGVEEHLALRRGMVKVILETAAFPADGFKIKGVHCSFERAMAELCDAAMVVGADFVETSTGFHVNGGATVAVVKLLARLVDGRGKVKASGGIGDYATVVAMIQAGASRIGASKGIDIITGAPASVGGY